MNTRFLFIVSLIVFLFAVWFYRNQGELDLPTSLFETNIEYQATDILAVQTNQEGIAEYSLTADKLTNYANENTDKLDNVTMHWRPNVNQSVKIDADQAAMHHDTNDVVMKGHVVFANQSISNGALNSNGDNGGRPPLILKTTELTGNLLQKQMHSDKPITVTQAQNKFEAESFNADMVNGDYEFANIAVEFTPPTRDNVALF